MTVGISELDRVIKKFAFRVTIAIPPFSGVFGECAATFYFRRKLDELAENPASRLRLHDRPGLLFSSHEKGLSSDGMDGDSAGTMIFRCVGPLPRFF